MLGLVAEVSMVIQSRFVHIRKEVIKLCSPVEVN